MRKYTHLFFDLDNTLWDFEKNSFHAMRKTFSHFKLNKKNVEFRQFFDVYSENNRWLWADYRNGDVVKNELIKLRFQLTFEQFELDGIDPLEMNAVYLSEMPKQKLLVEGAVEVLDYLKRKGYALFIITNGFQEVQHKKLEITGLKKYFTKVFVSENIKAPKPDKRIFEYALKSANAKKSASLVIGDNREVDVAGALNFGIDAVWFDLQKSTAMKKYTRENTPGRSEFHIQCLSDLKSIV